MKTNKMIKFMSIFLVIVMVAAFILPLVLSFMGLK